MTLELTSAPQFLKPRKWNISHLPVDGIVRLADLDVRLDGTLLASLTEAATAELIFSLFSGNQEITRKQITVRLLAEDEWGGLPVLPEILAAFVRPNNRAVEKLLKSAAEVLRSGGKQPGIEGYQSGKRERVWELAAAIWAAICKERLDYAVPPASFETTGQKIRNPSRIMENRLATCLDLALLFASCFEQAGLNPIVVISKEHAFAGCWLLREDFPSPVIHDAVELRKRAQLGELVLCETTLVTAAQPPGFRIACERGAAHLAEGEDVNFELAVDVRRARQRRILPVSQSELEPAPSESDDSHNPYVTAVGIDEAPPLPEIHDRKQSEPEAETPTGRIERWKRRLLDLSLNNRLLNFRPSKRAIPIICPDPNRLEEQLAAAAIFKILPRPDIMTGDDPRDLVIFQARHDEDAERLNALESLDKNEIFAAVTSEELEPRLTLLYRAAREALESSGANILYLAVGFLRWKRDEEDSPHKAPLVLLPVTLERKSVRSGFRLHAHEDEPRFNFTLIEMLHQDFDLSIPGIEEHLKRGEAGGETGIDIASIWTAVRVAIRDVKGFEVVEEAVLSSFSFTKYLMWKDLVDRTDVLKRNPVVRHLIDSPHDSYGSGGGFLDPRKLDQVRSPEQTFCPLLADSSQLTAVAAAADGLDFVLIGPPGTGKSQTITNMIAQNLAMGRRVLFVSEKMAALDVVYRRLNEAGLGEFCLELHSNKARKVEVLAQLRAAWAVHDEFDAEEWEKTAARLKETRDNLNRYVERLHLRRSNGLTAYYASGVVAQSGDVPVVPLQWADPESQNEEYLDRLSRAVDRVKINAEALGTVAKHPLASIGRSQWSSDWQSEFGKAIRDAQGRFTKLLEAAASLSESIGIKTPTTRDALESLAALARLLPDGGGRGFTMARDVNNLTLGSLESAAAVIEQRSQVLSHASVAYRPEASILDLNGLIAAWRKANGAWFLPRIMGTRKVRCALTSVADGKSTDPLGDLGRLVEVRKLENELTGLDAHARVAGRIWAGVKSDPIALRAAAAWGHAVRSCLAALYDDPVRLSHLRERIASLCNGGNSGLLDESRVSRAAARMAQAHNEWKQAETLLFELGQIEEVPKIGATADWTKSTAERLTRWHEAIATLRAWCAWQAARREAYNIGLRPLVDAIESGEVPISQAKRAFEVNYCRWWSGAIIDRDEVLRSFVSAEHEHLIGQFRELDRRFVELTSRYIRGNLARDLPPPDAVGKHAEWGLLSRELAKRRRHLALRQLISQLPTVLTRLTPCMLMSPLSIAQYVAPDAEPFDLVIFDEASQISVWDAIGAIARGKQLVVVGDPKQLPPTSFFDRADNLDNSDDDVLNEDLESILDELIGANLPQRELLWHYRSRHESLIAFSNQKYYGGRLITFPSPETDDTALSYVHVPRGVYERGGGRVNRAEATAVVQEVVRNLRDPVFVSENRTIGVVTFNSDQQNLIEDLLDAERRKDPGLETFFVSSKDRIEPVFVKNLETVQGDERDVILFSIGFGPDAAGKITMNFGPLNKLGGERRLNVAVTRARQELKIFGTLRAENIDLSRTSAEGVCELKHFLEFAERGSLALAGAIESISGLNESPFETAVEQAMVAKGWQVRRQVGVSGYRIDLGIVHPDAPGKFLAGVECDGATYHRAATARDRDRLRDMVLRNLGWRILRTWSTDWWTDRDASGRILHDRLLKILEDDRAIKNLRRPPSPSLDSTGSDHEIDQELMRASSLHGPGSSDSADTIKKISG
ncbi:MAG: DUF4011 domain-containing protein [Candidatus Binataceae bacterium]